MLFSPPAVLSIRKLLGNTDSYYQIPDYQRPYKWTDSQLEKLWDDIFEASDRDPQENYFLGPIITAEAEDGNPDSAYKNVVDGQQRLTTLAILLCAVREKYPNINRDCKEHLAVTKKVISDAIAYGDTQRIRFRTHDDAQTDFDTDIAGGTIGGLEQPKKSALKTDESKHKFINSALFFYKKLDELKEEGAGKFINFLFDKVEVIRIDCRNLISAMKIFQVINSTGIDLTTSDLVKSLLLGKMVRLYKDDQGVLDGKRREFIANWLSMEKDARESDSDMEELLTIYEYYAIARPREKSMYEELEAEFDKKDPNMVAGELKKFFETYKASIYNEDSIVLHSCRYLPWSMLWKSILLAVILCRKNDFAELAKAVCRFYYTYWIGGKTLSRVKPISFTIIKMVKEGKPVECIKQKMQDKMDKDKIAAEAKANLAADNIADEKWCKPLLLLMEYGVTDNSAPSFIEAGKNLHLEHVLPVGYRKNEWKHISNQVAGKYLHSAGNLTLLSGKKNIAASNNSFPQKMKVYEGKGLHGDQDQGVTAFDITRKILDDYKDGTYEKQWNEKSMLARKCWFLGEAEKILKIGIDPKKLAE